MKQDLYNKALLCSIVYLNDENERVRRFKGLGYTSVTWFDKNDTQAAMLRRGDVSYLIFRGTDSVHDWILDADIRKIKTRFGYVHHGFWNGLNAIWNDVLKANDGLESKYVVCGHSLGAAEATLAACLLEQYDNVKVLGVYLFGSPRVGGYSFKYPKVKTFRVVNGTDIVTRVPSPVRFKHVGDRIYINRNGKLKFGISAINITLDRFFGRIKRKKILDGLVSHPIQQYLDRLS